MNQQHWQDVRFVQALKDAPDAQDKPAEHTKIAIKKAAANAVKTKVESRFFVHFPWVRTGWQWLGRPTGVWGGAFASVCVAMVVVGLWYGPNQPNHPLPAAAVAPTKAPAPTQNNDLAVKATPSPAAVTAPVLGSSMEKTPVADKQAAPAAPPVPAAVVAPTTVRAAPAEPQGASVAPVAPESSLDRAGLNTLGDQPTMPQAAARKQKSVGADAAHVTTAVVPATAQTPTWVAAELTIQEQAQQLSAAQAQAVAAQVLAWLAAHPGATSVRPPDGAPLLRLVLRGAQGESAQLRLWGNTFVWQRNQQAPVAGIASPQAVQSLLGQLRLHTAP